MNDVVVYVVRENLAVDRSVPPEILVPCGVHQITPSVVDVQFKLLNPAFLLFGEIESIVQAVGFARRDDVGEIQFPFARFDDVGGRDFAPLEMGRHGVGSRRDSLNGRRLLARAPKVIVPGIHHGQERAVILAKILFRRNNRRSTSDNAQLKRDDTVATILRREMAEI